MKSTPGMIVDLRNNGGGSLSMTGNLLTKFLSDKTKGTKVLTRTGKAPTLFFIETISLDPELKGTKETAYTNPVVILTNQNSAEEAGRIENLNLTAYLVKADTGLEEVVKQVKEILKKKK